MYRKNTRSRNKKRHTKRSAGKYKYSRKYRGGSDVEGTAKIEKYIEKTKKDAPTDISGVPLVIYRSWMTADLPVNMKAAVDKTIAMTPEFDNHFFSDEDCLKFLQENYSDEPNVANAFRALKPGAFASDYWRYCVLYKKGGVYLDIKMELHMPLIDILKEYPKIFIGNIPFDPASPGNPLDQVWNGLMTSPPNNPVFRACIDEVIESCKTQNYRRDPLDITGPCLLWRMIHKFESETFLSSQPFEFMKGRYGVYFREKEFITQYEKYRDDQGKSRKTPHYGEMWYSRNVFDTSVQFV